MAGCIQVVGEAAQDQDQLEGTTIVPAGETAQDRPIALRFCAEVCLHPLHLPAPDIMLAGVQMVQAARSACTPAKQ